MAYEMNENTSQDREWIAKKLFADLASCIAVQIRLAQTTIQLELGVTAFRSMFQQLDATVVALLAAKSDEDSTCLFVPTSIARKVPVVASSMDMQQSNVDLLGLPMHFAAQSNDDPETEE